MLPVLTFNCSRVSSELTSPRRGSSSASSDDHGRSAGCVPPDSNAHPPGLCMVLPALWAHASCFLVVCAWRTRSAPELGPAHSARLGLAAHAFDRAVSIPLTHPLAFSLSPFLNARLPRPRRCGLWLCCDCLQSMPQAHPKAPLSQGLYSTLKGY